MCAKYDFIKKINEKYSYVMRNRMFGVIDNNHKEIVSPQFNQIYEFNNIGFIVEKINFSLLSNSTDVGDVVRDFYTLYGLISNNGEIVLETKYYKYETIKNLENYNNKLNLFLGIENSVVVDDNGDILIQGKYKNIKPFFLNNEIYFICETFNSKIIIYKKDIEIFRLSNVAFFGVKLFSIKGKIYVLYIQNEGQAVVSDCEKEIFKMNNVSSIQILNKYDSLYLLLRKDDLTIVLNSDFKTILSTTKSLIKLVAENRIILEGEDGFELVDNEGVLLHNGVYWRTHSNNLHIEVSDEYDMRYIIDTDGKILTDRYNSIGMCSLDTAIGTFIEVKKNKQGILLDEDFNEHSFNTIECNNSKCTKSIKYFKYKDSYIIKISLSYGRYSQNYILSIYELEFIALFKYKVPPTDEMFNILDKIKSL